MVRKTKFGEIKFDVDKVYSDAKSFGGNAYEGSAQLGKIVSYFTSVICIIIGALLVYYGLKFWRTPNKYSKETIMIITEYTSSGSSGQAGFYSVKGKTKECGDKIVNVIDYVTTDVPVIGSSLKVFMDPKSDCGDVSLLMSSNDTIGKIMVGFGSVMIVWCIINLYLTTRFKGYAALQGANVGAGLVQNIF